MKNVIKVLLTTALFATGTANADIVDRIDSCERSGGAGQCVYSILRELATSAPARRDENLSYCQCERSAYSCDRYQRVDNGSSLSVTLKAYTENLTTGRVTNSRSITCWNIDSTDGDADSVCQAALQRNPRCAVRN